MNGILYIICLEEHSRYQWGEWGESCAKHSLFQLEKGI